MSHDGKKRSRLLEAAVWAGVLGLSVAILAMAGSWWSGTLRPIVGTVVQQHGQWTLTEPDKTERRGRTDLITRDGDVIETPSGSSVRLRLGNGATLVIDGATGLTAGLDGKTVTLKLAEGRVLIMTSAGQAPLVVTTPRGQVRITEPAQVSVRTGKSALEVAVASGRVELQGAGESAGRAVPGPMVVRLKDAGGEAERPTAEEMMQQFDWSRGAGVILKDGSLETKSLSQ